MILVDLKKGIISMKGDALTVNAELGMSLRRYHEIESERFNKEFADESIDSLCKTAKLSDKEIELENKKRQEENSWIDELAEKFAEEIMKGFKL